MGAKETITQIAATAGITINGDNPWDIKVHNEKLYRRVLSEGSLGLGEAYMDGWWDCERLDQFFCRIISEGMDRKMGFNFELIKQLAKAKLLNMQSRSRAKTVIDRHYDLSPELYMGFLGPYNQYTSLYFSECETLELAEEKKLRLICEKLNLQSQDRVLDIGCGWGGFAKFAAERFGCSVVGVSISEEQIRYAREFCKGLPVEIIYLDYRDLSGKFPGYFDKVLVCGMIEHVGHKNHGRLMREVSNCINDEEWSLFLLDTIGANKSKVTVDPWINRYIFPGGIAPSIKQLGEAAEDLFIMEDLHSFGPSYDKTLMAWHDRFVSNWDNVKHMYGERFYRMFEYYLLSCAGGFRARIAQQWQIVFSKRGYPGGYEAVR
ncbi:MAG: cyclopropane-fatty-acyl-phospholipid synthase [Candidatus Spechtbacteria bacterium RIFCSPHIGHO2_02_FULL_43_15b]|nr:MAG: cyclopropane-fatty-acyl-phospholipid synthase [Candidatus Spechtbacteria bacterium RIFCSPHIGHO2_02_FULL_43_15b]